MKKRILPLILALALLVGCLSACGTPSTPPNLPTDSKGAYQISKPEDLLQMAQYPQGSYVLESDLDMTGLEWIPVENFSGTFSGNEKTISNLSITQTAKGSQNMGLFGSILKGGSVTKLNLANITVDASQTNARNIGTFAGINNGNITKCTVTGTVTDTRTDAKGAEIAAGIFAGRAGAGAVVSGAEKLSVTDGAGVHVTEGLCADVNLFVADSALVSRGFVGIASPSSELSGMWRDNFNSSLRLSEEMRQRQETAVSYMEKTGSLEWTVSKQMSHTAANSPMHCQTFEPGEVYKGMVYNHTASSYERFAYAVNEDGTVKEEIEALGDSNWDLAGSAGGSAFTTYMGTDCSGAVSWGWLQISPSQVANLDDGEYQGGVFVLLTSDCIPNAETQETKGIYPVGGWNPETHTIDKPAYVVGDQESTIDICKANGDEVMYEAYAMTRKADAVLYGEPGGHIRMLAADPVIIRNAQGTIDPNLSYLITHEQGDGLFNSKFQKGYNSSWRLNYRYTLNVLLNGSSLTGADAVLEAGSGKGYLPITIRALRDETVNAPVIYKYPQGLQTKEITAPDDGAFGSNFRFESSTVVIKNSSGKEVYNQEVFVGLEGDSLSFRFPNTTINLRNYHGDCMDDLPSGDYTFTITAKLSDGSVHTIVENQAFSHTA